MVGPIVGMMCGIIATAFLFVFFFCSAVVEDEISTIAERYFGHIAKAIGLQREVDELRRKLKSERKHCRKMYKLCVELERTLETYKEGIVKGCTLEAVEEQVRWKRQQEE